MRVLLSTCGMRVPQSSSKARDAPPSPATSKQYPPASPGQLLSAATKELTPTPSHWRAKRRSVFRTGPKPTSLSHTPKPALAADGLPAAAFSPLLQPLVNLDVTRNVSVDVRLGAQGALRSAGFGSLRGGTVSV